MPERPHGRVNRRCHSHAVDFLLKGGHVKALQARLGHSSIKTTLDVYGHYVEGMDDAAATAIDAALRDITYNP